MKKKVISLAIRCATGFVEEPLGIHTLEKSYFGCDINKRISLYMVEHEVLDYNEMLKQNASES